MITSKRDSIMDILRDTVFPLFNEKFMHSQKIKDYNNFNLLEKLEKIREDKEF